jgi:hypothetical protein
MATIYRFIVESQSNGGNNYVVDENGEVQPLAGAGSKMGGGGSGGNRSLVAHNPSGRNTGGVDHNRYMRPINPLLNRWTGGYWEKGQRVGRSVAQIGRDLGSGAGLKAFAGTGGLILLQFAIMEFDKWFREQQRKAKEENKSNYLKIVSGQTVLGQDYKVSRNIFGKITYSNQ